MGQRYITAILVLTLVLGIYCAALTAPTTREEVIVTDGAVKQEVAEMYGGVMPGEDVRFLSKTGDTPFVDDLGDVTYRIEVTELTFESGGDGSGWFQYAWERRKVIERGRFRCTNGIFSDIECERAGM